MEMNKGKVAYAIVRMAHVLLCEQQNKPAEKGRVISENMNLDCNSGGTSPKGLYITEVELERIITSAVKNAIEQVNEEEERRSDGDEKPRIWEVFLLALNAILFPFHIHKHFKLVDRVHDNLLAGLVSFILWLTGVILWAGGVLLLVGFIIKQYWVGIPFLLVPMMFGSFVILAANSFNKERNSERIYAYSASILALLSCIAGWIAVIMNEWK